MLQILIMLKQKGSLKIPIMLKQKESLYPLLVHISKKHISFFQISSPAQQQLKYAKKKTFCKHSKPNQKGRIFLVICVSVPILFTKWSSFWKSKRIRSFSSWLELHRKENLSWFRTPTYTKRVVFCLTMFHPKKGLQWAWYPSWSC